MAISFAETAMGWLVVAAMGGGAYYYYTHDSKQKSRIRAKPSSALSDTDRQRKGGNASDSASGTSSKAKKTKPKVKNPLPVVSSTGDYRDEPETDDLNWAQQLENRRRGTSITTAKKTESKPKTVKQTNANKVAAEISAGTSTTGGADGDDDRSPSTSPQLGSSDYNVPVSGDISDMLEAPTRGPSILRIVPAPAPLVQKAKKELKPLQQEETKKQRQNRRKAEDRKAQQEEDERIRKSLLEKQRRTAREARGEPAKNGVARPPATNAWTAKPVSNGAAPLLDTFEGSKPVSNGAAPLLDTFEGSKGWQQLPSEEEQMRILLENDESAWSTVSSKKVKRKNTLDGEDGENGAVQSINASTNVDGFANRLHD
jgi:hypothetical protein